MIMNCKWIGYIAWILLLAFVLVGCDIGGGAGVTISFGTAEYDVVDNALDYGMVAVGTDSSPVTVTVLNQSEESVLVTSLSVDDTINFDLTVPPMPLTLGPGESEDGSLVFSPGDSGLIAATISATINPPGGFHPGISIEGNVNGTGDYAPTVRFKTTVSGADLYPQVNGDYYPDPIVFSGLGTYKKPGAPDQYIYYFNADGSFWGIDPDFTVGYPYDELDDPVYAAWEIPSDYPPDSEMSQWAEKVSSPTDIINVKTQVYYVNGADVLAVNYDILDEEGDPLGATLYQWYRSDSQFDDSSFSPIPGETSDTYEIVAGDFDYFFRVEITPFATSGITQGEPVESDPYLLYAPPS